MCGVHTAPFIQWGSRGGVKDKREGPKSPPPPHLPAHPPPPLLACLLLYSLCASSHASQLTSSLASVVVDSACVLTWHRCLFVKGGWRSGADMAWVGNRLGVVVEGAHIADSMVFVW